MSFQYFRDIQDEFSSYSKFLTRGIYTFKNPALLIRRLQFVIIF